MKTITLQFRQLRRKSALWLGICLLWSVETRAQTSYGNAVNVEDGTPSLPPAAQFYDFEGSGEKGFVSGEKGENDRQYFYFHKGISLNFEQGSLLFDCYDNGFQSARLFAVEDVNGDGRPDYSFTNIPYGSHGNHSGIAPDSVLISNADGTYSRRAGLLLPNADLNMDGRMDLLEYVSGTDIYLHTQQPNGSFVRSYMRQMTFDEYEASIDQAEYEAYLQAVQAAYRSPRPHFGGVAGLEKGSPVTVSERPTQALDMNGDGVPDLSVAGTGTVLYGTEKPDLFVASSLGNNVKARDLNGDGFIDYVIWDETAKQLKTMVYRGEGNYQTTVLMSDIAADKNIYCYDFDRDGDVDILATFSYPYNNVGSFTVLALNDGNGNFTVIEDGSTTDQFLFAACCDSNGDGYYDLLVFDVKGMEYYVSNEPLPVKVMYGQEGGRFGTAQALYTANRNNNSGTISSGLWSSATLPTLNAEDLDNDGKPEIWLSGDVDYHSVSAAAANTAPTRPAAPSITFNAATGRLDISWAAASDAQSSACDLSYEVRIGSAPGRSDALFVHANADGARRNFSDGNAGNKLSKVMDVSSWKPGSYYVAVQAIDPQHSGSAWSEETAFEKAMLSSLLTVDKTSIAFCDSLKVYYNPLPESYTLTWNVDGATQLASSLPGELHLRWAEGGTKTISLQITAPDGATSETAVQKVDVLNNKIEATIVGSEEEVLKRGLYQGWFADWDMDGKQDALIHQYNSSATGDITGLWKNDGAGAFIKLGKIFNLTFAPTEGKWMDWDRDGVVDLFYGYRDIYGDYTYGWLKNNLSDNFTKADLTLTTPLYNNEFGKDCFNMADMNNDGLLDPIKLYWSNDNQHYTLMQNTGNGLFKTAGNIEHETIGKYETEFENNVADWNKDGFLDYYIVDYNHNPYYEYSGIILLENKGNFHFERKTIPFPNVISNGIANREIKFAVADMDNDGFLDIVYAENEKRIVILHNERNERFVRGDEIVIDNKDISIVSYFPTTGPNAFDSRVVGPVIKGDLDNNGYIDVLFDAKVENQQSGVYALYNDGNGNYRHGLLSDRLGRAITDDAKSCTVADTNGDGVPDIYLGNRYLGEERMENASGGYDYIQKYRQYDRHLTNASNTAPQAPTGLIASQTATGLVIEWDAAVDVETPATQMRYNLSVKKKGATGANSYIISPLNGGNAAMAPLPSPKSGVSIGGWTMPDLTASKHYLYPTATRFEIPLSALPAGEVEISVQAIDLWDAASPFSAVLTKNIEATANFNMPTTACFDTPVEIIFTGAQGGTPQWDFDGGTVVSGAGFGPYQVKWNSEGIKNISLSNNEKTATAQIKVLPDFSADFTLPDLLPFNTKVEIALPDVPPGAVFTWSLSGNNSIFIDHDLNAVPGNTKGWIKIISGGYIYRELTLTVTSPGGCSKSYVKGFTVVAPIHPPEILLVYPNAANKNVIAWESASLPENTTQVLVYKEGSALNELYEIGRVYPNDGQFTDVSSNSAVRSDRYAISAVVSSGLESPKSEVHQTMHLTINRGVANATWNLIWNTYKGRDIATYRILHGTTADNLTVLDEISGANTSYTHVDNPAAPYYAVEYVPAETAYRASGERTKQAKASAPASGRSNVVHSGNANSPVYVSRMNIMTTSVNEALSEEQPSIYLYSEIFPNNATYQNTAWSIVSGSEYATILNSGKLQATGNTQAGSVTVKATAADGSGVTATRTFVVQAFAPQGIAVTGVTLNTASQTLQVGDQLALTASVLPENATNKQVSWNSSNHTVATVNAGLVSVLSEGTSVITVITDDGGFIDQCVIRTVTSGIDQLAWNAIVLYPNPVRDYLTVKSEVGVNRAVVTDVSGSIWWASDHIDGGIDLSRLPRGMYILRLETDKGSYLHKLMKQ